MFDPMVVGLLLFSSLVFFGGAFGLWFIHPALSIAFIAWILYSLFRR